ncbi:GrpB family protein [Lysinibacillus xylanilyticus]|uniref:GrpB family protein n=1 Tax=Lysinibacillus xylanilyticus TaxID=582475 RepID=UPI003800A3C9
MILGLKKNEVKIVPYDSEWKNEFIQVRSEIIKHTNIQFDRIQHIGSTSIEGIQATLGISNTLTVRKRSVSNNTLTVRKQSVSNNVLTVRKRSVSNNAPSQNGNQPHVMIIQLKI